MTNYVGQGYGGVKPINDIERQHLELMFTEFDRRLAFMALQHETPMMPLDLYIRLRQMTDTLGDYAHQANYFVEALHEKARQQGRAVLVQTIKNE